MREDLEKKIQQSIKLLRSITPPISEGVIEIAYSGGKDSDVILQLAKESGIKYRAIYRNTTIDPPGTIKHVIEMGVEIVRPKISFFKLLEKKGLPNRQKRFCCEKLKEYKILDKCIMGVRKAESTKRMKMYNEPTQCRYYGSKKNHVEAIYPILEWTNEDVRDFILDRKIKCAPVYYDDNGKFHVERRLGCMCCPLAYKPKRILEFKAHPNMVKSYVRHTKVYFDNHPSVSVRYENVYEWVVRDIFYPDTPKEWESVKNSMFGMPDCKKFLEDYFKIKL